jgi:hypothetical protein
MLGERYRGSPYDGESIWAWKMEEGRLVPLTLEQCKAIILFARVPKFIKSLRLSVLDRLRRGTTDWEGDGSHDTPCLLLKTATEAQKRAKRITVSLKVIDKTWQMNLGVAIRLIEGHDGLSPEQKKGLINRNLGWVVSHICGNWKCVNPHHITVEPRKANAMRKNCFEVGRCFNPHKRCFVGMKKPVARQTNAAFQVCGFWYPLC